VVVKWEAPSQYSLHHTGETAQLTTIILHTYIPRTPEPSVSEQDHSVGLQNGEEKLKDWLLLLFVAPSCTKQDLLTFYPKTIVNTKKRQQL